MLLSVSTAADGNRIAIFIFLLSNTRYQFPVVPQNIYECNVEFDNRCYFKHLNLYGHGFFRTVSGSLFRVTFIPGSENRKSYEFFFSYFRFLSSFFYGFEEWLFWNFLKVTMKKQHDRVYILLYRRSQELRCFWRNFLEFQEQIMGRATVKGHFWGF